MEIYNLSYNDILTLDKSIKNYYLELFNKEIEKIDDKIYSPYKPLYQMIEESEHLIEEKISQYFFEGEEVNFYPIIKTYKAKENKICHISGDIIYKNQEYIYYKVFLYLKRKKEAFILRKPINTTMYYETYLPKTLREFETFAMRIKNSYECNLEEYYNFYGNYKSDISLRKLTI